MRTHTYTISTLATAIGAAVPADLGEPGAEDRWAETHWASCNRRTRRAYAKLLRTNKPFDALLKAAKAGAGAR